MRAVWDAERSSSRRELTVGELLARWLVRKRSCAPGTYASYEQQVRLYWCRTSATSRSPRSPSTTCRTAVPVEVAKAILGHSDVRLTLNRYRHVQPEEYDRAAAAMERRLIKLA